MAKKSALSGFFYGVQIFNRRYEVLDVLIVGAGPAGLATAIEAQKEGLKCLILDRGSVVEAIRKFPNQLTFFSTPELLEIGNVPFIIPTFRPTRIDCVRYYQTVAEHYSLTVKTHEDVSGIEKQLDGFTVRTSRSRYDARNLVVATGYFDNPNPFDVPGSDLPKVHRAYHEPFEYGGKNVAVVGGKNSAVEISLDLFRHGAQVTLIHRGKTLSKGVKYWILPDIENRIKSGQIKAFFRTEVKEVRETTITTKGRHRMEIPNDDLFAMIGYRPDVTMLASVGVRIDRTSAAPFHNAKTMETNVPGLYVAGSIAAGKFNNKIFIENGREHGKLIVRSIKQK
jgi:thioredoxin reductase (NADPH)